MNTLKLRDNSGQLQSYTRNFEQYVIERARDPNRKHSLDELYDAIAAEWDTVWSSDGFVFSSEDSVTLFLLRWS